MKKNTCPFPTQSIPAWRGALAVLAGLACAQGVSQAQTIYVTQEGATTASEFNVSGTPVGSLNVGTYNAWGVAVNKSGDVFVGNEQSGAITEYSPGGASLGTFATLGTSPTGLAFDNSGNLYATDQTGIAEYNSSGSLIQTISDGNEPYGVAISSSGNIFVANLFSSTIAEYTSAGVSLGTFASTGVNHPMGLAFDASGNLYVANPNGANITKYNSSGAYLGALSLPYADDVAVDASGNIYGLADTSASGPGVLEKFSSTGTDLGPLSTSLYSPFGIAIAPAPEPSTLALSLVSLASVGGYVFRRRK